MSNEREKWVESEFERVREMFGDDVSFSPYETYASDESEMAVIRDLEASIAEQEEGTRYHMTLLSLLQAKKNLLNNVPLDEAIRQDYQMQKDWEKSRESSLSKVPLLSFLALRK